MPPERDDIAAFKGEMRSSWDSVAMGWLRWWETIERGSRGVSLMLLELAGVKDGQRVLDVATGLGEPAVSAALRVDPGGHVTAIDLSPGMLAIARERAREMGLGNIDFLEMDGECIELGDRGFDAVLSRWGLMFFSDPGDALRRIYGLLREGGVFAASVWDEPQNVPMISLAMDVVRRELDLEDAPSGGPGPFSLAGEGRVERALSVAGFRGVSAERVAVEVEFPSPADYARYVKDVAGPVVALMRDQTDERRAHVWRAVRHAAGRYARGDGRVRFSNRAICVSGRR